MTLNTLFLACSSLYRFNFILFLIDSVWHQCRMTSICKVYIKDFLVCPNALLLSLLFFENLRYIKFKNLHEIVITTIMFTSISITRKQKSMLACFTLPYIYCFRLSKASSFHRKKLNMCNKLVTLRLVQIK